MTAQVRGPAVAIMITLAGGKTPALRSEFRPQHCLDDGLPGTWRGHTILNSVGPLSGAPSVVANTGGLRALERLCAVTLPCPRGLRIARLPCYS